MSRRRIPRRITRMSWKTKPNDARLHKFMSDEERAIVNAADEAKKRWQKLRDQRAGIINRALQRARYAARAAAAERH